MRVAKAFPSTRFSCKEFNTPNHAEKCGKMYHISFFEAAANNLDELTETVTSYISFCEDMCIPIRTHLTYNNDKTQTASTAQDDAYGKGDKVLYKQVKYTLEKEIRVAKSNYSDKLRIQLSSCDSASEWKGMKYISSYKTTSSRTVENQQQADNLNEFSLSTSPHNH